MWKRCVNPTLLIATLITVALAWALAWVLVFKFGWRHEPLLGMGKESYDANESFVFYIFIIGSVIACIAAPVLFVLGAVSSGTKKA